LCHKYWAHPNNYTPAAYQTSLNITDTIGIDVIPIDKTDAIYSGHLAQVEHGVQFMNGPIPNWIQDHVVHTSPVPVQQLVMH